MRFRARNHSFVDALLRMQIANFLAGRGAWRAAHGLHRRIVSLRREAGYGRAPHPPDRWWR